MGLGVLVVAGLAWAQSKPEKVAEAPAAPPVSLSALVDQAVARYPRLEGDVVEVNRRELTLSLGRRQGVEPGLTFSVVREGREIRHPRTGESLGRTEDVVGRATVTKVFDSLSAATFDGSEARVNDRVRTGTGKVKLTLLTFRGGVRENLVEAVTHELYDGLVSSGRFDIVMGEQIAVWLTQQGITPAEFLQGRGVAEAATRFKAEHILAVTLSMVERKPFMDVRLFAGAQPEPVLSTTFFVPPSIKPRTPGQFSASDRPNTVAERKPRSLLQRLLGLASDPGIYSSGDSSLPLTEVARFGFPVVAMDLAVPPADRIPRLLLSDGDKVYLYKIVNRTLEAEWTYSGNRVGRVMSVWLVDIDEDDRPEAVIVRYDPKRGAYSLILDAKNGKPSVLVRDIDSWLVGLDETGSGIKRALWSQDFSPKTLFAARKVDRVTIKDGRLVSPKRVSVPDSFRATGVTMSNIMGKDSRAFVYVDEYNRLRIGIGAEESWRSSASVGGGGYLKVELINHSIIDGISKFYSLEPTPLAIDLDADGVEEVIVPQNQIPGLLAVIYRSPAGVRFQQVNSGFEGLISGVGGFRGEDGQPTLILSVVRFTSLITKRVGESQIIITTPE